MSVERRELEWLRTGLRAHSGLPAGECPDADRLWAAVAGELTGAEKRALVEHTAACPSCAEGWRLARALSSAAPVRRRHGVVAWKAVSLAATVAAVVLTWSWLVGPRETGAPVYRSSIPTSWRPAGADIVCPEAACRLTWSGPPDARYRVELMTTDYENLYTASDLETTSLDLPEEALRALKENDELYWQVEASLGGRAAGETALLLVELASRGE